MYYTWKYSCMQSHGNNVYSVHKKWDSVSTCPKLHMRQTIVEAMRVLWKESAHHCRTRFISLNCLINLVVKVLLKCLIRFPISFHGYSFPDFCTQISLSPVYGVRISSKARATAVFCNSNTVAKVVWSCSARINFSGGEYCAWGMSGHLILLSWGKAGNPQSFWQGLRTWIRCTSYRTTPSLVEVREFWLCGKSCRDLRYSMQAAYCEVPAVVFDIFCTSSHLHIKWSPGGNGVYLVTRVIMAYMLFHGQEVCIERNFAQFLVCTQQGPCLHDQGQKVTVLVLCFLTVQDCEFMGLCWGVLSWAVQNLAEKTRWYKTWLAGSQSECVLFWDSGLQRK